MVICIVEDEPLIAKRIERTLREIISSKALKIITKFSLEEAIHYVQEHSIDLLLLDLNLNGKNGFDLLKYAVSGSFHTIVISAYSEKAIEAYEYGVLDFVPKPFTIERLEKAVNRFENCDNKDNYPAKYVAVRKNEKLLLIKVNEIAYIKGAGIYSEIVLESGQTELHDKPLNRLLAILPSNFTRIHKSYIVNLDCVKNFLAHGGSKYELELSDGKVLPVSRIKYKELKALLTGTSDDF